MSCATARRGPGTLHRLSRLARYRVRAMRWTQNDKGEDLYEEASDLIFFPKRLELKPGDKKIVRVGVNEIPASGERAYRLFLEEMAPPAKSGDSQTKLSVLVNIGVPVFISPPSAKPDLTIDSARAESSGALHLHISNKGTSRVRLSRVVMPDGTLVRASTTMHTSAHRRRNQESFQ